MTNINPTGQYLKGPTGIGSHRFIVVANHIT